jgi:hypothetical protein
MVIVLWWSEFRPLSGRHRGGGGNGGPVAQHCQDTRDLMEVVTSQLKILVDRTADISKTPLSSPNFEYLRADPPAGQVRIGNKIRELFSTVKAPNFDRVFTKEIFVSQYFCDSFAKKSTVCT